MKPLISIVIPSYNRKNLVVEAINSALQQDPKNFEVLVVDDGSTDGTVEHLNSLGLQIRIIRTEHAGISHARNTGIQESQGEFISFLDSDDLWMPGILDAQLEFLNGHPQIPLVYTDQKIWANGELQEETRFQKDPPKSRFNLPGFVELVPIHVSAVMVKKSLFDDVGMFNEELKIHEDTEMWNRISEKYDLGYIERPLSVFRWEQDPEHILKPEYRQLFLTEGRKYMKIYEERRAGKLTEEEQKAIQESYIRIDEIQRLQEGLERREITEGEFQSRKEQIFR